MSNLILDAYASLSKKINKMSGNGEMMETTEGIVSDLYPELTLEMSNEELGELTDKWEVEWNTSSVKSEWKQKCTDNENYWLGKHFSTPKLDTERADVDNALFESLETYLPRVTRRNPEPVVLLKIGEQETDKTKQITLDTQKYLGEIADEQNMRLKLKSVARRWALYLIGVGKISWDMEKDMPTMKSIRPQKILLDPKATIDEDGYSGDRIGEYRKMNAGKLITTLEKIGGEKEGIKAIKESVKENLGTDVQFIEWWTDEYMCWKLGKDVLLKKKNPNWNYDTEKEAPYDEMGQPQMTPEGKPLMEPIKANNFFAQPKKPFIFLTIFNLGKQPVDETGLMSQNLSNQDRINKRNRQVDKNADSMNGGMVVSLERSGLTQGQATRVTEALRKGGTVSIPSGSVNDAIARMSAPGLPADVYNDLVDTRRRLSDIFGTSGSMTSSLNEEKTVRGKFMNQTMDTDRIGGGVSEYLEKFSEETFKWFLQLLFVFDDKYRALPVKLRVKVKEGSLLPKDSASMASQAIDLAQAGKMSLLDLYKKLDHSNPEEMAANVWLEINAPEMLYASDPRVAQVIQMRQAAAAGANEDKPSRSISFKDLPPEGKSQLAKQAGIELDPEALAAHEEFKDGKEAAKRSMATPDIKTIDRGIQPQP
jgi:hypothetical protein